MPKALPARDECPRCGSAMHAAEDHVPNGAGHHATLFRCSECGHEVQR
jgi:DNA-directed RNA polymerase subunit M/transcription elongation factor TFIIS